MRRARLPADRGQRPLAVEEDAILRLPAALGEEARRQQTEVAEQQVPAGLEEEVVIAVLVPLSLRQPDLDQAAETLAGRYTLRASWIVFSSFRFDFPPELILISHSVLWVLIFEGIHMVRN